MLLGLVWGVVVWLVMGLIIGPALNPLLRDAHPTHYFVSHLVYGAMSALVLAIWARRVAPTVTPP